MKCELLLKVKNRKAPRYDRITGEALKHGGSAMIEALHMIFRKIWAEERTPADMSRLLLTPVHKKGNRLVTGNHRAITLNSIPGKVFCGTVLYRIQTTIEAFISDSQFFTVEHSVYCAANLRKGTREGIAAPLQFYRF